MGPIDSGQESQLQQPAEGLAPGEGEEAATWQMSNAGESHSKTMDSLSRKASKRRTKTGCLTCRRRRIKCGEEKPICNNCIKSKRECEGYSQPLVFKRPVGVSGAVDSNQQWNFPMQPMSMTMPLFSEYDNNMLSQQSLATGSHLPVLAPRPSDPSTAGQNPYSTASVSPHGEAQVANTAPFHYPPINMHANLPWAAETVSGPGPGSLPTGLDSHESGGLPSALGKSDLDRSPEANLSSLPQNFNLPHSRSVPWQIPPIQHMTSQEAAYNTPYASDPRGQDPFSQQEISPPLGAPVTDASPNSAQESRRPCIGEPFVPTQVSPGTAYDYDENEDYSDAEGDVEMLDQEETEGFNQLSLIMTSANRDGRQLRSFTTHLNEPNILAFYRPTFGSSPLNNPKTARIFAHFLHSTGPSLSIFERHPADSSIVLGAPVPAAQQGLWTYTLPLLALENQALLQAILAVSSLHISFLQRAPSTPALKHYHYALRRIGSAVSLPLRRKQIGTLAAILLLGYYEVIAAEYTKWSSHMGGSSQLLREIDFATMTRDLRAHRRRVRAQREQIAQSSLWFAGNHFDSGTLEDDPFAEKEGSIDERFIGSIMGRVVNYDEFGQVDNGRAHEPKKRFSRKDVENHRILCDLYWWYKKQDIIQTLISGNKLFTPYSKWSECPPRAGAGRLDAIYGSADHLWLLLARLADFGYRDRKRKLKAAKSSGVEWRPSPELSRFMARFSGGGQGFGPQPPSDERPEPKSGDGSGVQQAPPGRKPSGPTGGNTNPGGPGSQRGGPGPQAEGRPMYGMIPPLGPVPVSSVFANSADRTTKADEGDEDEQDMTYRDAEGEWEDILAAFDTFTYGLGRDFLPLPPDTTPPISTPFGQALQYRTDTIAAIWGFYYAGRIMLYRFHPSMPPAMMVSAGVAVPTTAEYGQIIGRIAGGIYYPQRYNFQAGSLNPNMGSCLVELTVPIYFSAVQYTDTVQRRWIVTQMHEVSRLTGWESANVMVRGCESAWVVAAKQGRGPPYERLYQYGDQNTPFNASQMRDEDGAQQEGNSERRFVAISNASRKHWAMGILSLEDDVLNLDIEDRR